MRWLHIGAGLVAIATGFVALFALKGGLLHRRVGLIFVVAMVIMTGSAITIAGFLRPNPGNVVTGVLTLYLVSTAFLAVRRHPPAADWLATCGALAFGLATLVYGAMRFDQLRAGHGYPPQAFFVFGAIGLWFAWGDYRILTTGRMTGLNRMKRHLGRMCGALLIATGSLFMGQPQVFTGSLLEPASLRIIPVLLIVGAMIYSRRRLPRTSVRT
jgi:uncharacterized membrane protein